MPIVEEKPQQEDSGALSGDEKEDEDLDGIPLDGAALLKSALMRGIPASTSNDSPLLDSSRLQDSSRDTDYDDDIDGVPCECSFCRLTIRID